MNFSLVPSHEKYVVVIAQFCPSAQTPLLSLNDAHLYNLIIVSALYLPSPVLQDLRNLKA